MALFQSEASRTHERTTATGAAVENVERRGLGGNGPAAFELNPVGKHMIGDTPAPAFAEP